MVDEYIRREDAINALEEKEHEPWYLHKDLEWISGVVEAKDEIKAIEPADVAPVVQGKWKKIGAWGRVYRCNQCGNFLDFDGVNAGRGDANFCPNCGAKMDAQG